MKRKAIAAAGSAEQLEVMEVVVEGKYHSGGGERRGAQPVKISLTQNILFLFQVLRLERCLLN